MTEQQEALYSDDELEKELSRRAQESAARKDDTGRFRDIFKDDVTLSVWRPGEGGHIFDMVVYRAGEHDPRLPKGTLTYGLEVWVHFNVGPTEDSYVCPARTFGDRKNPLHQNERCPVCEHRTSLRKEENYDEDEVKALNPKRRVLYNVLVLDNSEEENKGVRVWNVAHWLMEKHLSVPSERRRTSSGAAIGTHIPFARPDQKGKSISFTRKGKGQGTEFLGHKFEDRNYFLDNTILSQAKVLDEIIHIPTYRELFVAFHGYSPEEASFRVSAKETISPVGEEDDIPFDKAPAEGASQEEGTFRRRANVPPEQTITPQKENPCPAGGIFGKDEGKLDGCQDCPQNLWRECATETQKVENTSKSQEQPPSEGRRTLKKE